MAGTATVRVYAGLVDLGTVGPLSTEFTITSVDEYSKHCSDIATGGGGTLQVPLGTVNTVTGLYIKVLTGGTSEATGIGVDLDGAETWALSDFVMVQGQAAFIPGATAPNLKNLDSSVATVEFIIFGANS